MITEIRNVQVFENGKLSNEDYHEHEHISSTGLTVIADDCPAVFKYAEQEDSQALHFGTASHAAMLEPELFEQQFVRDLAKDDYDEKSGVLKTDAAVKAWLKERGVKGYSSKSGDGLYQMAEETGEDVKILPRMLEKHHKKNEGKTLVDAKDYDNIIKMRNALFANKNYAEMLKDSYVETSIICEVRVEGCDDWIGIKIRPDIITKWCEVPDYKTTRDVRPEQFGRLAFNANYWMRLAFVTDVLSQIYGNEFKPGLLAQGKASPFIPQMYWMSKFQIEIGREQYTYALKYYNDCVKRNVWPAYADEAMELETPPWVANQYGKGE